VVLRRLVTPLALLLRAAATGNLETAPDPTFSNDVAITVVLASEGYPDTAAPNRPIHGLHKAAQVEGIEICHAATATDGDHLVATGGRVLSVVALGKDFHHARNHAYEAIEHIKLEGSHFRKDIAKKVAN
jgi:phosphoribosylamine--glycine ligase